MHILNNVKVWLLVRKILDLFFGLYWKRIKLISSFGFKGNESVLDIGCGTGQYAPITKGRYLGIDMDAGYIAQAKDIYRNNPTKQFVNQNLNDIEFAEKSFDVSLLIDLTHHITEREIHLLFSKLNRVTKNYIIICDPTTQSTSNFIGRFLIGLDRGAYIRTQEKLLDLIKSHFKIIKIVPTRLIGIEGICVLACPLPESNILSNPHVGAATQPL